MTVVAFESRRATEFERLLARHDATFLSAPALREIPLTENPEALRLIDELEAGRIDAVLLLTGVGTRALVEAVEPRCPRPKLVELLRRVPLIARGPKPVAALRELGLEARVRAPEPNTWREVLDALDRELPVSGLRVAVQEYGRPNPHLLRGLEERGATPVSIPVYRWALPEDLAPLRRAIERLRTGPGLVVAFTTAVQLDHLREVAGDAAPEVLERLRDRHVIASIGPTASEALREQATPPDIEPEHPKLGYFVQAIAEGAVAALARKGAGPG